MPSLPAPTQTDLTIQDQTTGVVDFLKYVGKTLVASSAHDYGLGSDFKVVASGNFGSGFELVAQSQSTGQLDFLSLDGSGNLTASFLTSFSAPTIRAQGFFGGVAGQQGPSLVGQLADGSLDFLAFDASHTLIASQLLANTIGLGTLVGAGARDFSSELFASVNTGTFHEGLVTQLADGSIDAIGLSGTFGSLAFASSFLLPGSAGTATVKAVNQNVHDPLAGQSVDSDIPNGDGSGTFGAQLISQDDDSYDSMLYDSGYGATSSGSGTPYGTQSFGSFAGWDIVAGGFVATGIFPVT